MLDIQLIWFGWLYRSPIIVGSRGAPTGKGGGGVSNLCARHVKVERLTLTSASFSSMFSLSFSFSRSKAFLKASSRLVLSSPSAWTSVSRITSDLKMDSFTRISFKLDLAIQLIPVWLSIYVTAAFRKILRFQTHRLEGIWRGLQKGFPKQVSNWKEASLYLISQCFGSGIRPRF